MTSNRGIQDCRQRLQDLETTVGSELKEGGDGAASATMVDELALKVKQLGGTLTTPCARQVHLPFGERAADRMDRRRADAHRRRSDGVRGPFKKEGVRRGL